MKRILFITVPLRESPTDFPPIAVLSMMNCLKTSGKYESALYNIDYLRPTIREAANFVAEYAPEILAISAVVSTSYKWVREFSRLVKADNPNLPVIVGGPLGASAELLLRKTSVDFVCMSEGEEVLPNFLEALDGADPGRDLESVLGLVFLKENELFSTGYAETLPKEKIYELDYQDLADPAQIDHYLPIVQPGDSTFGVAINDGNLGRRAMHFPCSKGCVAKCTFCHRWDKGIRYIPVGLLMSRLRHYVERYNVGFVRMSDENFGTDRKWLAEFCKRISPMNLVWEVSGMRVNCVSAEQLSMMKQAGCIRCIFGMETGSQKMLKVMNKGVKLEDNYNAVKLVSDFGLTTTVQLVLGMPGETSITVKETADFIRFSVTLSADKSPFDFSANYAQALPGTPLYEYARSRNLISDTLKGEEEYLLWVSDKNAANDNFIINGLTGQPQLRVLSWRPFLVAAAADVFIQTFGWDTYKKFLAEDLGAPLERTRQGYFNFPKEQRTQPNDTGATPSVFANFFKHPVKVLPQLFYRSTSLLYIFILLREAKRNSLKSAWQMLSEFFLYEARKIFKWGSPLDTGEVNESLRKLMAKLENQVPERSSVMKVLRVGRW